MLNCTVHRLEPALLLVLLQPGAGFDTALLLLLLLLLAVVLVEGLAALGTVCC
jgi:hypothetical protein